MIWANEDSDEDVALYFDVNDQDSADITPKLQQGLYASRWTFRHSTLLGNATVWPMGHATEFLCQRPSSWVPKLVGFEFPFYCFPLSFILRSHPRASKTKRASGHTTDSVTGPNKVRTTELISFLTVSVAQCNVGVRLGFCLRLVH